MRRALTLLPCCRSAHPLAPPSRSQCALAEPAASVAALAFTTAAEDASFESTRDLRGGGPPDRAHSGHRLDRLHHDHPGGRPLDVAVLGHSRSSLLGLPICDMGSRVHWQLPWSSSSSRPLGVLGLGLADDSKPDCGPIRAVHRRRRHPLVQPAHRPHCARRAAQAAELPTWRPSQSTKSPPSSPRSSLTAGPPTPIEAPAYFSSAGVTALHAAGVAAAKPPSIRTALPALASHALLASGAPGTPTEPSLAAASLASSPIDPNAVAAAPVAAPAVAPAALGTAAASSQHPRHGHQRQRGRLHWGSSPGRRRLHGPLAGGPGDRGCVHRRAYTESV